MAVEEFFQDESEEAQRQQVRWAGENLALGEDFFARFLRTPRETIRNWLREECDLPATRRKNLGKLWNSLRHLLSFNGSDAARLRASLRHRVPTGGTVQGRLPKWAGVSLVDYLEREGAHATSEVDDWILSFRFGDPYAVSTKQWRSTPTSRPSSRRASRTTGLRRRSSTPTHPPTTAES